MRGSSESASNESRAARGGPRVLICGVNWVGDSVMSMPALQAYRRQHPDAHITLLVKKALASLWACHDAPDAVLAYKDSPEGTWRAVQDVRAVNASAAYVLPNSFRSALIPYLAGVPERIGMPGHGRRLLLTRAIETGTLSDRRHQAYEYIDVLVPERSAGPLLLPRLRPPADATAAAAAKVAALPRPLVGLLPGAARGPAKRWPAAHFGAVGRQLVKSGSCGIVVMGAAAEADLCAEVAEACGPGALNLAGRTTLPEWIALLAECRVVICNDSGGMHLASAVGTPVVAVYGMTDPSKTGPLGPRARVLQVSGERARDIARDSVEAQKRLAAIQPEQVYEAAKESLSAA